MAKKNNLTTEALKKLVGYIILAATNKNIIDDLNVAQDSVFSSYKLTQLLDLLKKENEEYADKLVGALNKLSSEKTTVQPTLDNTTPNTLYLFSTSGSAPFEQFLRLTSELVSLGSTEINLDNMYTKEEADNKFATKQSLKDVTDKIGDTTQLNNTTIMEDLIEARENNGLIPVTKAQHNELVTNGSATINGEVVTYDAEAFYVITDDENSVVDMSQYAKGTLTTTIDSNSTDTQIPTAKATRDYVTGKNPSSEMITECSNSVLKFPIGRWNIYSSSLARSLDDLPIQTGGNLEVFSTAYNTESPWTGTYRTRMYRYATYTKGEYIRYLYSGATPGVIDYDSGWQKVCTTKVADVEQTIITSLNSHVTSGSVYYQVKNGVCYVSIIALVISADDGAYFTICSGLPKCASKPHHIITDGSSNVTSGILGLVYVSSNGELGINLTRGSGTGYCSFSYPVAES